MAAQSSNSTTFNPYHPLATPGSIVWCKFQNHNLPGVPAKLRPALVLANDPTNHAVIVAYGTSNTSKCFVGEFIIPTTDPDFAITGLQHDTKFDLANTVKIFYTDEWFARAPAHKTRIPQPTNPTMGALTPTAMNSARAANEALLAKLSKTAPRKK
ncbi:MULTISPECIES: type II toxin-antitoxin system PemK/MazF family toxin [Pantoea]|uniref:Type II toxin-antitoxin system PemK/MazF family toxin n=1 Tax=Pantoea brenneri TaxID=472694 RepID=A0ABU9MRW6_9GAMM|nr:type II toxin-antitoxin system PemK/MazF family toxin [Pantoea sp. 3.5.1]